MATYTFSEFHLDEAEVLIDLESTRYDLSTARDYVTRILACYNDIHSDDFSRIEALCVTAIIKYGRAFVGGVRKVDKKLLTSNLPPQINATHEKFLVWRNLHIAHSVNDYEMGRIQARYCTERVRQEGITNITVAQARVLTPSQSDFEELLGALDYFIGALSAMIRTEDERVLAIIKQIPLERVLEMNEPAMQPGLDPNCVTSSRKRKVPQR